MGGLGGFGLDCLTPRRLLGRVDGDNVGHPFIWPSPEKEMGRTGAPKPLTIKSCTRNPEPYAL